MLTPLLFWHFKCNFTNLPLNLCVSTSVSLHLFHGSFFKVPRLNGSDRPNLSSSREPPAETVRLCWVSCRYAVDDQSEVRLAKVPQQQANRQNVPRRSVTSNNQSQLSPRARSCTNQKSSWLNCPSNRQGAATGRLGWAEKQNLPHGKAFR